jgi:membrane protein DedA with SNARE-associated domain
MLRYWQYIAELKNYGYIGIFVIAFIAGVSIPLPISYLMLLFAFGGIPITIFDTTILHPVITGLSGGFGAGIGGTLVYFMGRGGRNILPGFKHYSIDDEAQNKLAAKFVNWAQRRGSMVVFIMSAMLNPVFAPMALAMGALKFRTIKFLAMCVAGNTVKAMIIAFAGYFGIGSILRLIS